MKKNILVLLAMILVVTGVVLWFITRGDQARLTDAQSTGREPVFTSARPEVVPTVRIAQAIGWKAGEHPMPATGLAITRFAEGLEHPRALYRLPNGDILVAETNKPASTGGGITGFIARKLMNRAGAGTPSANRITLLRDADGDGRAEVKTAFLTGLNSPYGMALVGDTLYVANTDAILAFPYKPGDTRITSKGRKLVNLPHGGGANAHWTRSLIASPDGKLLYVGIGSSTNIAEDGMEQEANRAAIIEINPATGDNRIFASGLRNPVGMAWEPNSKLLWTVVNERDMLGSDLVPDYLTQVDFGGFYGWPWNYWGGYEDLRVEPRRPEIREYTRRPDYALGNHVAPLGLSFAKGVALGSPYENGAFVALHGSWNRQPVSGYKLVYIAFGTNGLPLPKSHPVDLLTGFLDAQGNARGRPVDVHADKSGALLISDDVGNIIWRISKK